MTIRQWCPYCLSAITETHTSRLLHGILVPVIPSSALGICGACLPFGLLSLSSGWSSVRPRLRLFQILTSSLALSREE